MGSFVVRNGLVGLSLLLGGVFLSPPSTGAEVVLCKSFFGIVKAREDRCKRRETPIAGPVENAETICASGTILNGDGECVVDPNSCRADEVLLGAGGGCVSIVELVAMGTPKTVFVTSQEFTGDLVNEAKSEFPQECGGVTEGLEAGDCICQATADGAPMVPPGLYKAWLTDTTDSPDTRFMKSLGPYNRVDGITIATSYADLVGGDPLAAELNVNEFGGVGPTGAWTGTGPDGKLSGANCGSWADLFPQGGNGGQPSRRDVWTEDPDTFPFFCNFPQGIYCFGQ